jgi:hypothetical protein
MDERKSRQAKFPRLREIRETRLGWEVAELATRLQNRPSVASIYRLEAGQGIRPANAWRVFEVVNAALKNTLDPEQELRFEEKSS